MFSYNLPTSILFLSFFTHNQTLPIPLFLPPTHTHSHSPFALPSLPSPVPVMTHILPVFLLLLSHPPILHTHTHTPH